MRELPTGTVTFLFTDIEGSTKLLHELGPEVYAITLTEHRAALRRAFDAHAGVEVDTQGDAFFVAFADATEAVAAAAEAQRATAGGRVRVRMGLHTGTPHVGREGYVGAEVHLGARIAAAGHGGQVLLSASTRDLLPGTTDVMDLGEHRLKDFDQPVWIYQLGDRSFPPLKSISNTNLPRPASAFVGREREVAEITELLRRGVRLLTLTGPGGSGKTRLSIQAAAELVPDFRNGTFWVELAPVSDPALVLPTIANTIGARDDLADYVGERQMLLVLDNLEQVVAAGPAVADVVRKCPNLRVLATSRERLRVRDEVEYHVEPLAQTDAVTLFATRSNLAADDAVAALCERLDRLPLAIELAAARTSVMSPAQILERLARRLDLLKGGRDSEARQRTLRATIEWSYELLADDEKELFKRLAVFAGGWTLEAAESVADADVDVLQSLVDKSLVGHDGDRFTMLETIREYALDRLEASPDAEPLRRAHADQFLALAEQAEPAVLSGDPGRWLDVLESDHDNIRAALQWYEAAGDRQAAMRLAGALWEYWCLRGYAVEGWQHLDRLLAVDGDLGSARLKALTGAVHLAGQAGVAPEADLELADQAIAVARQLSDDYALAYNEMQLAGVLVERAAEGDHARLRRAVELYERSIPRLRELGGEHHALQATRALAHTASILGDTDRYVSLNRDNLERARALGDRLMEARALGSLGAHEGQQGRLLQAVELLSKAFALDREMDNKREVVLDLYRMSQAFGVGGRPRAAVWLAAAGDAHAERLEITLPNWGLDMRNEGVAQARNRLVESEFAVAWAEGSAMSADTAVERALADVGTTE